ncbi:MAG: response regulator, partial [Chitinispirillia bacterium]
VTFEKENDSLLAPPSPKVDLRGKKVLLIDPSANNRNIISHYLENWGCNCIDVNDSNEALSIFRENGQSSHIFFDILIFCQSEIESDIIRIVRNIEQSASSNTVKLISINEFDIYNEVQLKNISINGLLKKPIMQSELSECMDKIFLKDDFTEKNFELKGG